MLTRDPETQKQYEYFVRDAPRFALCANFDLDSGQFGSAMQTTMWAHTAGHHVLSLTRQNWRKRRRRLLLACARTGQTLQVPETIVRCLAR